MKLLKIKNSFKLISNLKFGIFILGLIAITSSFGSFIEQDEPKNFYEENYSKAIYGFIDSNFILNLGIDHVYTTWWFLLLLLLLALSLISCTFTRQFPLFTISKEYFFRKKKNSYIQLPFSIQIKNVTFLKENILTKIQNLNFYIYQKQNLIYAYKGLIGRISPILVHISLLLILFGSSLGAFFNFKAQEILPKGEIFHIQNPIKVGWLTSIPQLAIRVNDFWVEYEENRIHQFYSNIAILDTFGKEIKEQTISVNNPLRYKNIDFYQSDWNLIGMRIKDTEKNKIYEIPFFPSNQKGKEIGKSWITWIKNEKSNQSTKELKQRTRTTTFLVDQFQNFGTLYDENGISLGQKNKGDSLESTNKIIFIDILPSTGLLIKYDPSIPVIYLGFGFLMITACLSYLPYNQIWIYNQKENCWIGSSTNRGKIQLEIDFENFIRSLEYEISKTNFIQKNNS